MELSARHQLARTVKSVTLGPLEIPRIEEGFLCENGWCGATRTVVVGAPASSATCPGRV